MPPLSTALLKQTFAAALLALIGTAPAVADVENGSASALRASYAALRPQIEQSPFGKPLLLQSSQSADTLKGDIHAAIAQPFERVRTALDSAASWCDVLIVHPNVTGCRVGSIEGAGVGERTRITLNIGRRRTPVEFSYRVAAAEPDYLDIQLAAPQGPLGTSNYRIRLEATALDARHTILHLVYSHGYGMQARLAMRAYLGTFGRGKVGFTVVDKGPDGEPVYVDDFRGALERNAMRYYLCIEAYLESLSAPPQQQFEKRVQTWFAYTERYPLQLHEDDQYLELKRKLARAS